jgi:hypothetical protein
MKRYRVKANNFETRVKKGTYPARGVMQVINAVEKQSVNCLNWATELETGESVFSWTKHNDFCGCLFASIFSYAVQGRPKAVEQLDLKQFTVAWKNNIPIASTKFKTVLKYGVQIITIPEGVCKTLMKAYFEVVRPEARKCLEQQGILMPKRGNKSLQKTPHIRFLMCTPHIRFLMCFTPHR